MKNQMIIKISIIMKLWTAGWTINLFKIILATRSSCKNGEMRVRLLILPLPMDSLEFDSSIRKAFFSTLKIIPYIRKPRNRETGFNPIFSNSMSGHELAHPPVASTLPSPEFVWIVISNLSMPQICLVHRFEIVKALNLARPWFWVGQNLEFDKWFRICQGVEIVWSIILSLPKPWIFKPDV